MIDVELSGCEWDVAYRVGGMRDALSSANKPYTKRDPTRSTLELNVGGMAAELALAKHLGVEPDLVAREGTYPLFDMIWNGRKVEAKWNKRLDGDLLIIHLREANLYFLVVGPVPKERSSLRLYIAGSMEGFKVRKVGEWVHLRYGPCWRVSRALLDPINRPVSLSELM